MFQNRCNVLTAFATALAARVRVLVAILETNADSVAEITDDALRVQCGKKESGDLLINPERAKWVDCVTKVLMFYLLLAITRCKCVRYSRLLCL